MVRWVTLAKGRGRNKRLEKTLWVLWVFPVFSKVTYVYPRD